MITKNRLWRILIIEDNARDRVKLKAMLLEGSHRSYEFIEATSGREGIRLCGATPDLDCVVMDFHLLDMNAVEILAGLPRESFGPAVPVVILTGAANEQVSRAVLQAGAQDFVGKDWLTAQSITRAIENAIQRQEAARELSRQAAQQALLLEITRLVFENKLDEPLLVGCIFKKMETQLNVDLCLLHRMGEDQKLHVSWQAGVPIALLKTLDRLVTDQCQPVIGQDLSDQIAIPVAVFLQSIGARAHLCMPMRDSDGSLIGMLSFASARQDTFSPSETGFFQMICHSLELAFARRDSERVIEAGHSLSSRLMDELRSVTDNIPDIIARYDQQLRYVFVNAAITRATGLSPDVFLGQTNNQLWMPQAVIDELNTTLRATFSTGRTNYMAYVIDGAEGERRYEARIIPEVGPDQQVDHVLVVTRDVTSAWRAAAELARAKDASEAANAAKDQFLAVLSHELRTPLTPVRMAISVWERQKDQLPPEIRRDVAMIRRNVDLECRLIDDMLDLNRIARGKLDLQFARVDLHEEIRHSVETVAGDATVKQIVLSFDLDAENFEVIADAARIQQVLWNILKNAVKFTPPGGSVVVRTQNKGDNRICVEVTDTGAGIDPDALVGIFNAFEQGGAHITRQYGGLGLGLAISHALVEMHGGTLSARSEGKGLGATLMLELEVAAPIELPAGDRILPKSATALLPQVAEERLRILLVEDHADTARIMKRLLGSLGYEVQIAGNVAEALAAVEDHIFDIVISDLGLPDGNGYDLMRQMAASRPTIGIALSGYGMEEDVQRGLDAGFTAHLTKPINIEQLEVTIQQVSRRNSKAAKQLH